MAPGIVINPSVEVCGYGGLPKKAWNDIHAPLDHLGLQNLDVWGGAVLSHFKGLLVWRGRGKCDLQGS